MRFTSRYRVAVKPCLLVGSAAFVVFALSSPHASPVPRHEPSDSGATAGTRRAPVDTNRASPAKPEVQPGAHAKKPETQPGNQPGDQAKDHAATGSLADISKALRSARNATEARALERQAEILRQKGLSAATRLLLENADASLTAHDYRKAEAALDNALVLQPDKAFIRRGRARIRYAAGDFEGAISDLAVAVQQDPDDPVAWQLLSLVEEERHDPKAALRAARQVLAVDPLASGAAKRVKALQATLDGRSI